jgi:hypothetical protein
VSADIDPLATTRSLAAVIQDLGFLLNISNFFHLDRSVNMSSELLLWVLNEQGCCYEGKLAPVLSFMLKRIPYRLTQPQ